MRRDPKLNLHTVFMCLYWRIRKGNEIFTSPLHLSLLLDTDTFRVRNAREPRVRLEYIPRVRAL